MRVAVLGNSGSGKSTLARWIAGYTHAPLLDLDTVAWEPGKIAVARSPEAARSDLHAFCSAKNHWIVEGCYASLVDTALEYSPLLIFLNPGEGQCIRNCRARPWEAHKYASRAEQDQQLAFLLSWVSEYYTRGRRHVTRGTSGVLQRVHWPQSRGYRPTSARSAFGRGLGMVKLTPSPMDSGSQLARRRGI